MEFLRTENIVKAYAGNMALKDVNISVKEGDIFGLLGPNGAGKTSLIRIINQITAPDSGLVFLNGEKLNPKHIVQIGYLPEERGLYKKMKVGEQALYLAQLKGMKKSDAMKRLKYWFEKFEIQSWWDTKVEEHSKGEQQKIQFIITILHEPKLLIFDEPFTGFDPINVNILKQEILQLRKKGATIIFSTHNMESVEEICDHIALINKAYKILDGPITEIKDAYKNNMYELVFTGYFNKLAATLTANYEITEYTQTNDKHFVKIKLLNNTTTGEMLQTMLPLGNIQSFNEIIPSMNEIFIKVVEHENQKKQETDKVKLN
jgi:ABC-2 type transport system ATP-binding protein